MDIVLNSFIMSGTSFSDVKIKYEENNKIEYEKRNVLFLEDEDWTVNTKLDNFFKVM